MNEALCSILSGEVEWCFDAGGRWIKFNEDGTGELWCSCNLNYWICAELEWKSIAPLDRVEPPPQTVEIATVNPNKGPRLLGELNLEITLTKRLPRRVQTSPLPKRIPDHWYKITELALTDDAFRPRSYTIRIEKGNFTQPCYIGSSSTYRPRFALRLIFDKSPYPPRSEWRRPEQGPDDSQFWDHKEFVARSSPELEKQGRAMNDLPLAGWNACAVS